MIQRSIRPLLGGGSPPKPKPAPEKTSPQAQSDQAREYLSRVQAKITRLAEEFASGTINRSQFNELFGHYQRERRTIEAWMESAGDRGDWRKASSEGKWGMTRAASPAGV